MSSYSWTGSEYDRMSKQAQERFLADSETVGERFVEVLKEARQALRGMPLGPADIGSVLQLYGSMMKLGASTVRIRRILERDHETVQSHGRELVGLTRDENETFERWFAQLTEFDQRLADLDVAAIDIYFPGLPHELLEVVGGDVDFARLYNEELVPRYGIRKGSVPRALEHFVRDFSGDVGYRNRDVAPNVTSKEILGDQFYVEGHSPFEETFVRPAALARIARLSEALEQCRAVVAALVREHWDFRELAEIGSHRDVSLEVTMGDRFENIDGSTIVNRSLVERSFNKVKDEHGTEVAAALAAVAEEIARSGNRDAGETFDSFNEELQRQEPRKNVLRNLWSGVTGALPSLLQLTEVVERISKLFS